MTADAIAIVKAIFTTVWTLFTTWYIPGTHTTPAGFFMFCFAASISINFIRRLFGLSGEISSSNRRVAAAERRSSRLSQK